MQNAYICPLCNHPMDSIEHITEQWLLDVIRKEHPEWIEENGLCTKCIVYYRNLDHVFESDDS